MEGLPAPGPEQILGLDLLKSLLSIKRRAVQSVRQEEDMSEGMEEYDLLQATKGNRTGGYTLVSNAKLRRLGRTLSSSDV